MKDVTAKNRDLVALIVLWGATFQKYESWQANKVPPKQWVKSVVADYRRCSKLTFQILNP